MERYEYVIEGQKIVLTEADELFGLIFRIYDIKFREKVEEYYNELNEFSKTITSTLSEMRETKEIMIKNGEEETITTVGVCDSDEDLAYCIDDIFDIFDGMNKFLGSYDFYKCGIRYVDVSKKINEYTKKIAMKEYHEEFKTDGWDAKFYDILCESASIVSEDFLVGPKEFDDSLLRKYFLRHTVNHTVRLKDAIDFLEKCLTEEGRFGMAVDLYEDCIYLLLHYLEIFSVKCNLQFTPKYCSGDNYIEFNRERNKIEEDLARKKVVTKEKMICNLARFPFNSRQYGVIISEYGLFDKQIKEIAEKVGINANALEDLNNAVGPINLDESFENQLLKIIEKDIISIDGYTIIGNDLKKSNQKMVVKAQNTLGIRKNDKIFMLSDGTLFKSFKEGFAICSSGLYARNPNKAIHRKWSELLNTKIERKGTNLIIDGLQVFTYVKKEEGEQLFSDIKKLIKESSNEVEKSTIDIQNKTTADEKVAISNSIQNEKTETKENVEIRYCTECGAKVSSSAKFCQQCGNKLENTENVEEIKPQLFRVDLVDVGEEKAKVIKIIMDNFKMDVRSAKEMTDSVPVLLEENLLKEEADALEMLFRDAGAKVKLTRL